jgi:N-acetylmuramoyl-L-alanine amidase CwlD
MLKKIFIIISFILSLLILNETTTLHANPIKPFNKSLIINSKAISLATPLISNKNIVFFPIRDTLKHFNAKLQYQRKDDQYSLVFGSGQKCIIIPNSREFWLNNRQQYFSQPTIKYQNRLYVPLKNFFSMLGFSTLNTKSSYKITTSKIKPTNKNKSTNKKIDGLTLQTSNMASRSSSSINIPFLEKSRPLYLAFGSKTYDLKNSFFYKKNVLFIDLESILLNEQFDLKHQEDMVTISKQGKKYIFSTKNSKVKVISSKKSESLNLVHPIVIKNGKTYFPFLSFVSALNVGMDWNSKTRTITLISSIQKIQIIKEDNIYKLKVFSTNNIEPLKPKKLSDQSGFYIDIPFSSSDHKSIDSKNSPISNIQIQKTNRTTTRLKVLLKENISHSELLSTSFGAELVFYNFITNIKQTTHKNRTYITIKGNGSFKANVWFAKNPNRLIIDIPKTLSGLPQIIRAKNPVYHHIRTSQFQTKPLSTRIVIDLYFKSKFTTKRLASNMLEVSFPIIKKSKTTIKKKPKPKPKDKGNLSNKIIAIDPGHGGADPGAVGRNRIYEKNYTIDISNRLKKLLTKSGAYVVMVRKNDKNPSLRRRVIRANQNKADIFLSIHINSFVKSYARGTETYYYKYKDKKLARILQKHLVKDLKLRNNGVKRARMYVLRHSKMPTALVEPLFLTNPKEGQLLKNPAYRQKIAKSLYQGIKKYFNSTH